MHVASICFQVFLGVSYVCLQVFHLDVTYVCNGFQMFLGVFASVFQVFHLSYFILHSSIFFVCCNYCI
jgi:hypothetical protein